MSANKKDPRRLNLVVPYQEPEASKDGGDVSTSLATVMPMTAMLTRNRYFGWLSVAFSIMTWLGESEDAQKKSSTPGYFNVLMSLMALIVTYLPMLLPPGAGGMPGSPAAAAPAPAPAPVGVA